MKTKTTAQHVKEYHAGDAKELLQEEQEDATVGHLTDSAYFKLKALRDYEEERPEDV